MSASWSNWPTRPRQSPRISGAFRQGPERVILRALAVPFSRGARALFYGFRATACEDAKFLDNAVRGPVYSHRCREGHKMLCVRWHGGTSGIVWFRPLGRTALPGSTSFIYRTLAPIFRTTPRRAAGPGAFSPVREGFTCRQSITIPRLHHHLLHRLGPQEHRVPESPRLRHNAPQSIVWRTC